MPTAAVCNYRLEAAAGDRYYFWTGNGKPKTTISDWQSKLKDLFELAQVNDGHATDSVTRSRLNFYLLVCLWSGSQLC